MKKIKIKHKKEDLRKEFGNITGNKIRVENITYNPDYVHYLENKLVKLLSISNVNHRNICDCCGKNRGRNCI